MLSSDEEDLMDYYVYSKLRKVRRKYWIHPYIRENQKSRLFNEANELSHTDKKFIAFYGMSKESYLELTRLVGPYIERMNTNMRESVPAGERILITVRYLATGETFVSLSLYFARGESTVRRIVTETTKIIWEVLNGIYMPVPTTEQFKYIAHRFELLWNLPNCIGALAVKHIRIEKFPDTGSKKFNYKHSRSTVLLACCDADGMFSKIEPGFAGRNSDGDIYEASAMNWWMTEGGIVVPSPSPLQHDESRTPFPYYLVGDKAFPLLPNLMRPYSSNSLDNVKRIFNYRLSRGKKAIERVFGMAAEKFAVLNGPIRCRNSATVNDIIKAACILHNFVRNREGIEYPPQDTEELIGGTEIPRNIEIRDIMIHQNSSASTIRGYLANYFISQHASLPLQ